MSGSKNSSWRVGTSYSSTYNSSYSSNRSSSSRRSSYSTSSSSSQASSSYSSNGGEEVVGAVILGALAIPVAAATLAYYTGKVLVKGTIAGGKMAVAGMERYQAYQKQQHEKHLQQLEQRRVEACTALAQKANTVSTMCRNITSKPFMNDSQTQSIVTNIHTIVSNCNQSLQLEKAVEYSLQLDKLTDSLKSKTVTAQRYQQNREALLAELEQMRNTISHQNDIPSAPELSRLEQYRNKIKSATISNFDLIKSDWSNWSLSLLDKIKTVHTDEKIKSVVTSLWNSLPVSQEEAQQYDSRGFSELKRIESFIMTTGSAVQCVAKEMELEQFKSLFAQHKSAVESKKRQEEQLKAEQEKQRRVIEPKLEVLAQRLSLANSEIVKRWASQDIKKLENLLKSMRLQSQNGDFQTIETDMTTWEEQYTKMLTDAGLKQQAEERRQYLVEALQSELPKLGFDIVSLASKSDAQSDTVIKVVPHSEQKAGHKKQITISVPQSTEKPVNYKFAGYDVKRNRVEGCPVEENDTGKQTVINIAQALKPYGIAMSEPDWPGNPNKIQKNADGLPDSNNPTEEVCTSAQAARTMEMDW